MWHRAGLSDFESEDFDQTTVADESDDAPPEVDDFRLGKVLP